MSPVADNRPSESSALATLAIALAILAIALLIGYFLWWAPGQRTTVVAPQQPPQVVTPGPPGPPGPPGEPGEPGTSPAPPSGGAGPDTDRRAAPQDQQERPRNQRDATPD